MLARHFLRRGMGGNRRLDGRVVGLDQSRLCQPLLQGGFITQPLRRVRTMAMADAVVGPGEIVEKHRRPQLRAVRVPARGLDQPHGMHHHARDVGLAVQVAAVAEQLRRRHHPGCGDRDERWPEVSHRLERRLQASNQATETSPQGGSWRPGLPAVASAK